MTTQRQSLGPSSLFQGLTARRGALIDTAEYHRDGFALVEGFLPDEDLEVLRAETTRICRQELAAATGQDAATASEADIANVPSDPEVLRRFLCIHFPHKVSPTMLELLSHPRAVDNLVELHWS